MRWTGMFGGVRAQSCGARRAPVQQPASPPYLRAPPHPATRDRSIDRWSCRASSLATVFALAPHVAHVGAGRTWHAVGARTTASLTVAVLRSFRRHRHGLRVHLEAWRSECACGTCCHRVPCTPLVQARCRCGRRGEPVAGRERAVDSGPALCAARHTPAGCAAGSSSGCHRRQRAAPLAAAVRDRRTATDREAVKPRLLHHPTLHYCTEPAAMHAAGSSGGR